MTRRFPEAFIWNVSFKSHSSSPPSSSTTEEFLPLRIVIVAVTKLSHSESGAFIFPFRLCSVILSLTHLPVCHSYLNAHVRVDVVSDSVFAFNCLFPVINAATFHFRLFELGQP